ncbi:hypothetical protein P7C73_g3938, partial [Tremellales sp. Uapishka_1]
MRRIREHRARPMQAAKTSLLEPASRKDDSPISRYRNRESNLDSREPGQDTAHAGIESGISRDADDDGLNTDLVEGRAIHEAEREIAEEAEPAEAVAKRNRLEAARVSIPRRAKQTGDLTSTISADDLSAVTKLIRASLASGDSTRPRPQLDILNSLGHDEFMEFGMGSFDTRLTDLVDDLRSPGHPSERTLKKSLSSDAMVNPDAQSSIPGI